MSRVRSLVLLAAVVPLGLACGDPSAPSSAARGVAAPTSDLVTIEIDQTVTAEEFAIADADGVNGICVKATSSDNLLMKDANAATPSQLCPPAWQFVGKPQGIKIQKQWFSEDKNANGTVCVKFIGDSKTIVKDDNQATPSQPCPPAYSLIQLATKKGPAVDASDLLAADANANGFVCVNPLTSGNFLVRDDNPQTPSQPCPPAWIGQDVSGGGAVPPAEPAN